VTFTGLICVNCDLRGVLGRVRHGPEMGFEEVWQQCSRIGARLAALGEP
jgi:hypothetical protein